MDDQHFDHQQTNLKKNTYTHNKNIVHFSQNPSVSKNLTLLLLEIKLVVSNIS